MIAIHHRSGSYSEMWIEYCKEKKLDYCTVNLFDSNIIKMLRRKEITHLLFHFGPGEYKIDLLLKKLNYILEEEGIKVFPGYSNYWHYNDKLGQKYLFEHLNIPHAPMDVFYSQESAMEWVGNEKNIPFVFKLKRGAGSSNVKLVKSRREAKKLIKKMFGKGIKPVRSIFVDVAPRIRKHKKKKDWLQALLRFPKVLYRNLTLNRYFSDEKGYFLVQEFYPNNEYDTRVSIIGNKACAFRRLVRKGDFRASGSGKIDYNPDQIDERMIEIAYNAADKINTHSTAFDFIYDKNGAPKIIEISCFYVSSAVSKAGGYWDRNLEYHQEKVIPEYEILGSILAETETSKPIS